VSSEENALGGYVTSSADAEAWPKDPLKELLSFHGRIRAALQTLSALAEQAKEGPLDPMRARAVHDFFRGPVVWHDLDEELSLMPRLRSVKHPARLEKLLDEVSASHEELEDSIEEICPHLAAVAAGDTRPDPAQLAVCAKKMIDILEPHLKLEEQEVVPLARLLLSEEDLERMRSEMRTRLAARKGSEGGPPA
jgi:hemerythrin-like domain-containing protein